MDFERLFWYYLDFYLNSYIYYNHVSHDVSSSMHKYLLHFFIIGSKYFMSFLLFKDLRSLI